MRYMFFFRILLLFPLVFISCSNDDDGNSNPVESKNCFICSTGVVSVEYCDNGDGTVSSGVLSERQKITQELPLNGLSFEQFINNIRSVKRNTCTQN